MARIIVILSIIGLSLSATLGPCKYNAPDQVTGILPNYTGTVQPCSYAGFAPLDSQNDSALFYWYFPHQTSQPDSQVPLIIWLQGGPGTSSMYGLFVENGPFNLYYTPDGGISCAYVDETEGQSWAYNFNMLFIDNPAGVGFSYDVTGDYRTSESAISRDLWTAIQYFQTVHPETMLLNWYYSGESYAGRYVPAFGYYTLEFNKMVVNHTLPGNIVNLKGVLIGDGAYHGLNQRVTMIDGAGMATLLAPNQVPQARTLIAKCQMDAARNSSNVVSMCNQIPAYVAAVSGIDEKAVNMPANYSDNLNAITTPYLNQQAIYQLIHVTGSKKVGILYNASCEHCSVALNDEYIMGDSLFYLNELFKNIQVMMYEGTYDVRIGPLSSYYWYPLLAAPYNQLGNQTRNIWYMQGIPVGYWTQYYNVTHIIVDFAGHFVPYFTLAPSVLMVQNFVYNQPWDPYGNRSLVNETMCDAMNNCNGHGSCTTNGICICNAGYGLGDCSAQAETINQTVTYTLQSRDYDFFVVPFTTNSRIVVFSGDQGELEVFYTGQRNGPVPSWQQADISMYAQPGLNRTRSLYLTKQQNANGYLTVHNTNYFNNVSYTLKVIPVLS